MLWRLYVKNFALIEEATIEFGNGLNILTGETGAGKSILIDAVTTALGGKVSASMIRTGADSAFVELVFSIEDEKKKQWLSKLGVEVDENNTLIISRKIMPGRSACRVNDETVTVAKVKKITSILIDIHGQHEHQSLFYHSKHLEILDEYAKTNKEQMQAYYKKYKNSLKKLETFTMSEDERIREMDFCRYEVDEIEKANLKEGEEEELETKYKKASHAKSILEALSLATSSLDSTTDLLGQSLRTLSEVTRYDESISEIVSQLSDAESLLTDAYHEISGKSEEIGYEEEQFEELSKRLDLIHGLYAKYGRSYKEVLNSLETKRARLEELENYEILYNQTKKEIEEYKQQAIEEAKKVSKVRAKAAGKLSKIIEGSLKELNFLQVEFKVEVLPLEELTEHGLDEVKFMISTNPGEPLRGVSEVASGGELSRIMLALKTVLADSDEIPTLIFDEIDTGISGRTAQQVSQKLAYIGKSHQVLCITHLPQIAAMANEHFLIEKSIHDNKTITAITCLDDKDSVEELARLLGGVEITEAVRQNALEMKELARKSR
ncbi:DNA repair protein RecN [Lachnospiraceae bacterium TWA4]|nr:DNA repair protein RecN [Lachnospiraceae bacterium TWA4]